MPSPFARTQAPADDTGLAETLILLTSDIVAAHVSNNSVAVDDMASLISSVHAALAGLGSVVEEVAPLPETAVSIRAFIKPEYIVCLDVGKKLKTLKRHLMTHYIMTPKTTASAGTCPPTIRWSRPTTRRCGVS